MSRCRIAGPMAVACLSVTGGCAPMIAHGPNVHSGFSGGVSVAAGLGPSYENGDDPGKFYEGAFTMSTAYGWRPRNASLPAVRVGAQVVNPNFVGADLYVQAPPTWLEPFAAGVGVLAEFIGGGRLMPYVQGGVENARGYGLHLVAGRYDRGREQFQGYWAEERAQVTWLSAQLPLFSRGTAHLHAGYASGHVRRQFNRDNAPYIDEDRWTRLGGVTLELHRPRK